MTGRLFPENFLWGVATSAQQIEGATREGGRGESIWDRFAAIPGRISDGSDTGTACDHFHRWRDDIRLMQWLGVKAYRFSIAWPRIFPDGRGAVNEAGLDFYDAIVDALLEANIQPFATLYHWDLPQALQDNGGWARRETVDAFATYATVVAARLGDRVKRWITHNEPWCVAILGHELGEHAPGHRNPTEALKVAHNVLLSHGRAVDAIRRTSPGAEVGITLVLSPAVPATQSEADRDAARRFDGSFNRWYLDPLFRASYPQDAINDRVRRGHLASASLPFVESGDLETIAAPVDFLGVNYYCRSVVRANDDGEPVSVPVVPREELTDMGWEVFPRGLYDVLLWLHNNYSPMRIYITENGAAYADGPDNEGRIADKRRIEYLHGHLVSAHRALTDGVPLSGYFAWSLMDNFEWAHGYAKRFGLYWVDFETLNRIPKDSAFWYRDVVANNRVEDKSASVTGG